MHKGTAAVSMLKANSKKRRTKAEVIADREDAALKEQLIAEKFARLEELEQKFVDYDKVLD